jgi:tetratricopeptide (TPR) repeat protein
MAGRGGQGSAGAPAVSDLGLAHLRGGRLTEAVACFERAVALDPKFAIGWYNLGTAQEQQGEVGPAVAAPRRAAALAPRLADAHERLGNLLTAHGGAAEAIECFRRAAAAAPNSTLGRLNRAKVLHHASFTCEFFEAHRGLGSDCEIPVPILGMMRSGTTLVEQIRSSHSQIAAGGELGFWHERAAAYAGSGAAAVTAGYIGRLADDYGTVLRDIGPAAVRVTDKMPANFLWIGLIHLVFPEARIIHCRRHPVDICLSIYFTQFGSQQNFAYDRGDLVFYYRQYERLMAHWRRVLPPDRFIEVDYEELIADQERVSRRLVAAIGLDWEEACLRPEANLRAIGTASLWQARQPVYDSSVGRWRRYEPWLGEPRRLLPPS